MPETQWSGPYDNESVDAEEVAPRPGALIESLRSFGYSPATAVADLIDNSVTAGATEIRVDFHWSGSHSRVTILDNGRGMDELSLREAMRAGSTNPLESRQSKDLGRFGLGLKTASFSQARSLTVASKPLNGDMAVRRWDLDYVGRTDSWRLLKKPPPESSEDLAHLGGVPQGTLVIWSKLDRIVDDRPELDERARNAWHALVDGVRKHLEMVFHRFIEEDGLLIKVNGQPCIPWDPFLTKHKKTEQLPGEDKPISLPSGEEQMLRIQPYVLPHKSHLSSDEHRSAGGPRGWNQQQGFYLYRARRLIVAGDWFHPGMKPEEHHKLARIRVEITQDMDSSWNLDVRKSRARPPSILREDFLRIARATRERAQEVYRYRGARAVGGTVSRPVVPVWKAESANGAVRYRVNQQHPLVKLATEELSPVLERRLRGLLRLLEENLPVAHILSQGFSNENSLPEPPDSTEREVIDMARAVFAAMIKAGHTPEAAREYLLTAQPFERLPGVIAALETDA